MTMPHPTDCDQLRSYHPDRESLYSPASGPTIFGRVPNPTLACVCAELSRLAYTPFAGNADALRDALHAGSLELHKTFSVNGAQAFAARDSKGQTFLVFRGTEAGDPTDLYTDSRFYPERHAEFPGRVHAGFAASFLGLLPELKAFLGDKPLTPPLVLSGHSLGAALATLAASIFPGCRLVTFGSPRVGDPEFAKACEAIQVDRYVDCCDIVTEIPPEEILGYVHIGEMRYIDRDGRLHNGKVERDFVTADRAAARLHYAAHYTFRIKTVAVRELADHAPANYIRALFDECR